MDKKYSYYMIDEKVLPLVYKKVVMAKELLESGKVKTINDAVKAVKISRSAFYKYKDFVFILSDKKYKIVTLSVTLIHMPGVLSHLLNTIATFGGNILTINQNIPLTQRANVTLSIDISNINTNLRDIINEIENSEGIENLEIIAQE